MVVVLTLRLMTDGRAAQRCKRPGVWWLPLLLLMLMATSTVQGVEHVHIGGFFPMYTTDGTPDSLGWGVMPSVKLALQHVNSDRHVLPNTVLHVTWNDTQCNAAVAIKAFYDLIHNAPKKLALFGAACTHVTDPIAKASKYWNLAQLSYADTHPKYTARNFPNFYRVVPNSRDLDMARIAFVQRHSWRRVATLCQDNPRYTLAHNDMVGLLYEADVSVVEMQTFADKLTDQLSKMLEKDVRVILGSFDESWARRIFCQAHRLGMYGRKYQWLIQGLFSEHWWLHSQADDTRTSAGDDGEHSADDRGDESTLCSPAELLEVLQGVVLFDVLHLSNNHRKTVAGFTAAKYKELYDSTRENAYSRFHGYAYDGIWAIAYALHHVDWKVRHNRSPIPGRTKLAGFEYEDERWESLIKDALEDTSFEGVTGPVRFKDNDRRGFVMVDQFRGNSTACIGVYDLNRLRWLDSEEDSRITSVWWPSGHAPVDRTITFIEKAHVNLQIYIVLVIVASVGIVMAFVFLFVNIRYRNQRYIKMSSPYLNNLIIVGCVLTYTSVILLGLDSSLTSENSFPIVCAAKSWVLMAGFTLAFGSMFSKTWRVHSIFTNVKLNKKVIKDYQLFIVVGVLLSLDIAIMTTWQIVDPFYRQTKRLKAYPHPENDDAIIVPENEYCKSDHMTVFVGCIYAYKGLLMIFGCFLAWETRHVNIAALNDSKYIGMSVYNVVIMCVIGVAVSFVLSDHQDASFVIISVFILFCTTGTLCLVFVPKLIELRKSSQGQCPQRLRATLKPPSKKGSHGASGAAAAVGVRENTRRSEDLQARLRLRLRSLDHEFEEIKYQVGEGADIYLHHKMSTSSDVTTSCTKQQQALAVPRLSCTGREGMTRPSFTESTEITSLYSYTDAPYDTDAVHGRKRSSVAYQAALPVIASSLSSLHETSSSGAATGGAPAMVPGHRAPLVLPLITTTATTVEGTEVALGDGVVIVENVDLSSSRCDKNNAETLKDRSEDGDGDQVSGGIGGCRYKYTVAPCSPRSAAVTASRRLSAWLASSMTGRCSLAELAQLHLLTIPNQSGDQPTLRRSSDPGLCRYSLTQAIIDVNVSLTNIIAGASVSSQSSVDVLSTPVPPMTETPVGTEVFHVLESSDSTPPPLSIAADPQVTAPTALTKIDRKREQVISSACCSLEHSSAEHSSMRSPLSADSTDPSPVWSEVEQLSSRHKSSSIGATSCVANTSGAGSSYTLGGSSWSSCEYSERSSSRSVDSLDSLSGDSAATDRRQDTATEVRRCRGRAVQTMVSSSVLQQREHTAMSAAAAASVTAGADDGPSRNAMSASTFGARRLAETTVVAVDSSTDASIAEPNSSVAPVVKADPSVATAGVGAAPFLSRNRQSTSCPRLLGSSLMPLSLAPDNTISLAPDVTSGILPIFRKLAADRQLDDPARAAGQADSTVWQAQRISPPPQTSQQRSTNAATVLTSSSCPNICIKCDIVEYL